jgi:hypothetical protein
VCQRERDGSVRESEKDDISLPTCACEIDR